MGSGSSSPAIEREHTTIGSAHQLGARVYPLNFVHTDCFINAGFIIRK